MSSTNVTFATYQVTIPANSSKKYGNKNSSPLNYYSSSVSIPATENFSSAYLHVDNGWRMINGDYWTGPEFWITNSADQDVTCNLQVISVGTDSSSIEIEEITDQAVLAG